MLILVRTIHCMAALLFLGCIGVVYYCGLSGQRSALLAPATIALFAEGLMVTLNRGRCPLQAVHRRLGDDKSFFGLFLPLRTLPYVVPFWTLVTIGGFVLLHRVQ